MPTRLLRTPLTTRDFLDPTLQQVNQKNLAMENEIDRLGALTNWTYNEIPKGLINGSNKNFAVQNAPNPVSNARLFQNGLRLALNVDYTISGTLIKMTTAPVPGTVLLIDYQH